jgi:hypothetical protein
VKRPSFAVAAVLALVVALPTVAVDFGMTLSNDSTYTHQDSGSLQQLDRALAWLSSPLGPGTDLYVSGLYEFKGTYSSDSTDVDPWRIDAGRVELSGAAPGAFGPSSSLRYSVGRINTGDFSSLVLSGLSDGFRLEADFGNTSAFFTSGYRGLLYKDDAYSFMNQSDADISADDDKYLAPKRMFAGAGFRLVDFAQKYDLGAELFGQFDLSGSSDKTHSQYFEPYAKARLSHLLSWQAWGILEMGEADSVFWAYAFGESLVLSLPELIGLKLTQSVDWASGDKGSLDAFSPIRRPAIDAASYFAFTDLLELKLEASANPLKHLAVNLGTAAYFRRAAVDPEGQMALRDDAAYFRGFEVSTGASAKVTSDLSLNLTNALLVPNTRSAYEASERCRYSAELYAAFDL